MNALRPLAARAADTKRPGVKNSRLLAVSDSADLADILGRLLNGAGIGSAEIVPAGAGPDAVAGEKADLVLVDLGDDPNPAETVAAFAAATDSAIVAIGSLNDIAIYRRMLEAGASDYLVAPVDEGVLMDLVNRIAAAPVDPVDPVSLANPDICRLNLVIGARGGVGATTLAVSTAWLAAESWNTPTALLDLDLRFGTCALSLDLLPGPGLRDALENPERIDSLFVGSSMINATENLFVLGSEDSLDASIRIADDAIEILIDAIKPIVNTIVADLPRMAVGAHQTLLQDAHSITLVSDLTVAGLRDTVRLQNFLAERLDAGKVRIAVLELPAKAAHVGRKEFEQGVSGDVAFWLPHDAKTLAAAASQGKAAPDIAGSRHAYSKTCTAIAREFTGASDVKERRRIWRW